MNSNYLIFSILFLVAFSQANTNPYSYVVGRSGDIILKPKNFQDTSFVYLLNRYATELNEVSDQTLADLISHLVGGPVINAENSRNGFPKGTVFDKSTANLMFVVDSLESEYLSNMDLKLFKMKTQNEVEGKQIKLIRSSYPEDSIATLATISTGVKPSVHGITGSTWATQFGQISAYRAGALPLTNNLADVFAESYEGRSLIFSASADYQMGSAFGVNQIHHSPLNNDITLFYNLLHRRFESVYASSIDTPSLKVTWRNILDSIILNPLAMPGSEDTITYNNNTNQFVINLVSKKLSAAFTITYNDIFLFFGELQVVRELVNAVKNDPTLSTLVLDKVPDLFTFSFGSLKGIEAKYGKESAQFKIAVYLLDEMLVEAINTFSTLYENKITTEVIFLGQSSFDSMKENTKAKEFIYGKLKGKVQLENYENNFPAIYLMESALLQKYDLCEKLENSATDYQVFCPNPWEWSEVPYWHSIADYNNATNTTGTKDAAVFQITLWFSIIIVLVLLATVFAMCTMDIGADSVLFRTTNLKAHPKSN